MKDSTPSRVHTYVDYLCVCVWVCLCSSQSRGHSIQSGHTNLLFASCFKCHSPLSIFFLLSLCFLPHVHSIIVSIYLSYSPSAPKLCHPTIPPTPCALTALSLDGSSSSKAVTVMDCRLPQPLPLRLAFSLFSPCPRRKSSDLFSVWHLFLAGLQVALPRSRL